MKRVLAGFLFCALIFPRVATGSELKWLGYQEALQKASDLDRLIVVDVYTDWCGWCRKLDSEVYAREDVRSYMHGNFVSVKLNAEDQDTRVTVSGTELTYAQLASAYGVRSYPTTLFLLPDGKLLYGLRGFHPPDRFLQALSYFGEKRYLQDMDKSSNDKPSSPPAD